MRGYMKRNSCKLLASLTAAVLASGMTAALPSGKLLGEMFTVSASAADIKDSGKCGDNVAWELDSEGVLTISGTGKIDDFYTVGGFRPETGYSDPVPWEKYLADIRRVVVGEGVTYLGDSAFSCCTALESAVLPDSLKEIGCHTFNGCSLHDISFPDGLESIDLWAFEYCNSLEKIIIPDSVTYLGEGVFRDCKDLKTVVLPEKMTRIREETFAHCESLENIIIPDSVTQIDDYAFWKCVSLRSVEFPAELEKIGADAFHNCYSLDSVTFLGVPDEIGKYAFDMSGEYINDKRATEVTHIHIPQGSTPADFIGRGKLPADEGYYHLLTASGKCPDENCPMGIGITNRTLMIFRIYINMVHGGYDKECDINGDGKVNEKDLALL